MSCSCCGFNCGIDTSVQPANALLERHAASSTCRLIALAWSRAPGPGCALQAVPAHTRNEGPPLSLAILRAFGRGSHAAPWNNEETIREELFSIERLEQHAESLAAAQPVAPRPIARQSLAARLRDNESVLLAADRAIASAVGELRAVTPAAEWLLDNYHLVEEQIREIRDDLPPAYYRH